MSEDDNKVTELSQSKQPKDLRGAAIGKLREAALKEAEKKVADAVSEMLKAYETFENSRDNLARAEESAAHVRVKFANFEKEFA